MPSSLDALTLRSAVVAVRSGELTAEALTEMVLARADVTEPRVHAYVHLDGQRAMAAAREADRARRRGDLLGPLHGVPVGVKDLIATADLPTEAGSRILRGHRPQADAAAVRMLRAAGALIVGKQRTHEFGFGMDDPPTRSLWAPDRYAGGSSVGGAVSVSVGSSLAALGTDGGGSIRKPAAINGVVGFKPTFGAVPTDGVLPGGTSVDHIGWLTRDVADAELLWEVLTGADPAPSIGHGVTGLRIGCPGYLFRAVDQDIAAAVRACLEALADAGAELVLVEVPELELTPEVHGTLGGAELYRLHEHWVETVPGQYHPGSLRFLHNGARASAQDLAAAKADRDQLQAAMADVFADHRLDVLASPTIPLQPVPMEQMEPDRLLPEYTRLTAPFNVTGQPAISVPCGLTAAGLPVGLQLAGRRDDDTTVLRAGRAVEETGVWAAGRRAWQVIVCDAVRR